MRKQEKEPFHTKAPAQMSDKEVDVYLNRMGCMSKLPLLVNNLEYNFIVMSTAFGDGVYEVLLDGKSIGEFGVGSGLLSLIPIEYLQKQKKTFHIKKDWLICNLSFSAMRSTKDGDLVLMTNKGQLEILTA